MLVARSVLRADLSRFACALALVRTSARLDRVAMHDNISVILTANVHNESGGCVVDLVALPSMTLCSAQYESDRRSS